MSIMMEYLRQLQKNNQRDWFQSHKELRKEAEADGAHCMLRFLH